PITPSKRPSHKFSSNPYPHLPSCFLFFRTLVPGRAQLMLPASEDGVINLQAANSANSNTRTPTITKLIAGTGSSLLKRVHNRISRKERRVSKGDHKV